MGEEYTKIEIICIVLCFLIVSNITLNVYAVIRQPPECERIHLDDNMQLWGKNDVVPDEETANRIAQIVVETQGNLRGMTYYDNEYYTVDVVFNEINNEWTLYYNSGSGFGGGFIIGIRRDSGMVTGLAFLG